MTLKECLAQLCDIQLEVKKLEEKINNLEPKSHDIVSDSVDSTTKYFPIIRNHCKIKGLNQKVIKQLEYYKTILEERYEKLLEIQIQTELFINKIPISRIRRIFDYRYLEQYSWTKTAREIGGDATPDSVRMEHDRFLEKNELCSFCSENM